ncbi:hypothetical protein GCM10008018_37750 [Paenibacillus marchantiophytorum]|uniref:FHA domain-containing protein n=1 Tax=Paenibacillus marchantiophytorum TaxID=1619310 RepID=A0ABQ1EUH5_9BACL|nr:DUF6382 domain-containing protein [Paenibacillus marchantiophytorum]GFZ88085.1 hypothetical protein GCM10008018_37750 [Paenibacillus marchantiophytorum]
MAQEVFGLRYEFVYRHGHYMKLYNDAGLNTNDLSSLQVKMLETNKIPNLLPLEIQELDFDISLYYNLSAKRMLAHILKVEGLTKQQFAQCLFSIVSTLETSKNYMLVESGFVLHKNFIFIGSDWSNVSLTYVPLKTLSEETPFISSLEMLMSQLLLFVKEEEREAVKAVLDHRELQSQLSLQTYKELLLMLMGNKNIHCDAASTVQTPIKEVEPIQNLPKPHSHDLGSSWQTLRAAQEEAWSKLEEQEKEQAAGSTLTLKSINPKTNLAAIGLLFLLCAFLWQNYMTDLSNSTLQMTCGVTILLIDGWFVLRYLGYPSFKRVGMLQPVLNRAASKQANPTISSQLLEPEPEQEVDPLDAQSYYRNLPGHTALLAYKQPDQTVFLGDSKLQPQGPRIEESINGQVKVILIPGEHFTIGRGGANVKVDYAVEVAGVSRSHAEITKTDQGYEIQDTGSTNGTYLNGEALVTYQSYPLKDGDEIRIVKVEMAFRI